ncbi:putative ankyrin repeat-containing protein [Dactylonectria estremocensis]|uniref:Ankyrin repeat-containing protein n=1 Tax=Dactylonectria estremocensis TaxID=1079267 RepID=A0A9P9EFW6_9HYPO|nr:putative ankyrin repeat-containing protein [Dactylonectria estremocensis]
MDPLSVIASTIGIVQGISSTYKAIQHLKGLPDEFDEVNKSLPLAQDTLILARDKLQDLAAGELSIVALQPVVSSCEEKAKKLQVIFEKVEKRERDAKDGSALEFYRATLLRLGKAHRVETLMRDMLKGLQELATNQLFRTATQSQVALLKDSIDQLSNLESSVPDSDFEHSMVQNIASGGTGFQTSISGQEHNINSGSGKQFNAQTMNFVLPNQNYKARSDILQALYTSPYLDRKNRNPDRVLGTCNWFIGHSDFQQWQKSKCSNMLWVSANPGCGKSVLAKHLADSVLQTTKSRTTCYFFFKDDFDDQRSATSALGSILHQLLTQRETLFTDKIVRRFEAHKAHLANSLDELWEILVMVSQSDAAGELVCILDAFDECEDQEQLKFAQTLRKFYDPENDRKNHGNLKFLITSRPYDKIGLRFQPLNIPGLRVIHLKGENDSVTSEIAQEIDVYIMHKVSGMRESLCLRLDEEQLLLERLRRVPHQTYLWVYLTLKSIENDISIDKVKIDDATSSLPQNVDEAYEKILAKSTDSKQAKKMLHIIAAAVRPLTLAEMNLALTIRSTDRSYEDIVTRPEERFGRYARDLCGLFINITDSRIYLLHQTAKEFLVLTSGMGHRNDHDRQLTWKYSLDPPESHRILCQICISYLLLRDFDTHPPEENQDEAHHLSAHVFLNYSATHWASHFRAAAIEDDQMLLSLQQICDASSNRCRTWFRAYCTNTYTTFPGGFTTLMIASYFGIEVIAKLELGRDDVEINATDVTSHRSALSWASENGFSDIVKILIKHPKLSLKTITKLPFLKGAEVDMKDRSGRTPLSYAAWNGHQAIAQRLVKAGARTDSKDILGYTPITYAICSGHMDLIKQLTKGAQFDSVDEIRRELLLSSAIHGHDTMVKGLLATGASTETVDSADRTPLSHAAEKGHSSIIKQLLENGADTERVDKIGRTPLLYAVEQGNSAIVKRLLEHGASTETVDENRRTPLSYAAEMGHDPIVKQLLENGAITERVDRFWRTPLSYAAHNTHRATVQLLLDQGAGGNIREVGGYTPLVWAIDKGDMHIVRLLLKSGSMADFSFNYRDRPRPISL